MGFVEEVLEAALVHVSEEAAVDPVADELAKPGGEVFRDALGNAESVKSARAVP